METLLSVIHNCTVNIGEISLLFFAKNCNGILATDQQPNTGIYKYCFKHTTTTDFFFFIADAEK